MLESPLKSCKYSSRRKTPLRCPASNEQADAQRRPQVSG